SAASTYSVDADVDIDLIPEFDEDDIIEALDESPELTKPNMKLPDGSEDPHVFLNRELSEPASKSQASASAMKEQEELIRKIKATQKPAPPPVPDRSTKPKLK